jgi:thiol-disulfide isomerase/thioredoxin
MKRLFNTLILLAIVVLSTNAMAGELKPYKGRPLPDFELVDLNGKKHSIAGYKGKVLLVNFWATWCPPCVKEMPSMQRLQDKMAGKPFETLAVNMGEGKEEITSFLQKHPVMKENPLTFPILLDSDSAILKSWKIFAFPTTFLINKNGEIKYGLFGGLEWDGPEAVEIVETLVAE